jgi:putative IMPACT (imprinted ancient) family translation regulator
VLTHVARMTVPYSLYEPARGAVKAHDGQLLDQEFATEVTLTARFPASAFDAFQATLQELSNGQVQAEIVERDQPALVPLTPSR